MPPFIRATIKVGIVSIACAPFLLVGVLTATGNLHHGALAEVFMKGGNAARHTRADLDPAVYDIYVGAFALDDGRTMTVSRQGGRLFAQASGSPVREILPDTATSFFYADVPAQLTFEVDPATGKAAAVTLSIPSRQPLHGSRAE